LVLAGILARQADELREAFAPWVALAVSDEEDGWVLMTALKPRAAASCVTPCEQPTPLGRDRQRLQ